MTRNAALQYKVRQQRNKTPIKGSKVPERESASKKASRFTLKKTGDKTATILDTMGELTWPEDMTRDLAISTVAFMNEGWEEQKRAKYRRAEEERKTRQSERERIMAYQERYLKRGRHERINRYEPFDRVAWMNLLQEEISRQAAEVVAERIGLLD